jgi:hypothetical protein
MFTFSPEVLAQRALRRTVSLNKIERHAFAALRCLFVNGCGPHLQVALSVALLGEVGSPRGY